MRKPKDTSEYLEPRIAAAQLINLATKYIVLLEPGMRVKWSAQIRYVDDLEDDGSPVRITGGSFKSSAPPKDRKGKDAGKK